MRSHAASWSPEGSPAAHAAAPFDALAASYDDAFSHGVLGTALRARVWRRLDRAFGPGDRVLDLGCGTGEDALHLAERGVRVVALDASTAMVAAARAKVAGRALAGSIELHALPAERLCALVLPGGELATARGDAAPAPFDGVLSNFGVLNCLEDLPALAEDVARCTRPGARVFLCLMGPLVPWEWAWYLARGRPAAAFRRLRPGGVTWRGTRVRYPSIGAVRRAFAAGFRPAGVRALGAFLPPSYAEPWARRHPRLVARLNALERRLEAAPPVPWLADHYLLELVRR